MDEQADPFASAVGVACHDIRTPLATISGFAKTMLRAGELPEREQRFTGMIDEAASQIVAIVDQLGLAARIDSGRYRPELAEIDTLELARAAADGRVEVEGAGATVETDVEVAGRALAALAQAAVRHGDGTRAGWRVDGREVELGPLSEEAAAVACGSSPRDLGALIGRMALERLGAALTVGDGAVRVRF